MQHVLRIGHAAAAEAAAAQDHFALPDDRVGQRFVVIRPEGLNADAPRMRAAGWGRILCLTSVAAKQPSQSLILSTTARAGVLGFAKALSDEVAQSGVTVNVLCPGYFSTDRLQHLAETRAVASGRSAADVLGEMGRTVPIGRLGLPDEFAVAALFLASDPARYVTGTALSVDGGVTRSIL